MNYTITLIISISIILLSAIGIWTGFFEDIGRGAYNLNSYINSSDSGSDGGIVEDTVQDDDPEDSVLAVDETFNEVLATITAYTSSVEETDNTPCLSASGVDLCHNIADSMEKYGYDVFSADGVIACPRKYPFGTIVEIPITVIKCFPKLDRHSDSLYQDSIDNCRDVIEYKEYICLDRMNSRYDGEERFDIYFGGPENRQKAMEWGVQKLKVKVYFLQ